MVCSNSARQACALHDSSLLKFHYTIVMLYLFDNIVTFFRVQISNYNRRLGIILIGNELLVCYFNATKRTYFHYYEEQNEEDYLLLHTHPCTLFVILHFIWSRITIQ